MESNKTNKLQSALSRFMAPIIHLFVPPDKTDPHVGEIIGRPRHELISPNRTTTVANLVEETDRLFREAAEKSSSATLTDTCTKLISEARRTISAPDFKPDDVLDKLDEVKLLLIRARETRKLWPLFGTIFFVNLAYLGIFIWLIAWKSLIPPYSGPMSAMAAGIAACALWGGIGGVVDAMYSLNYHVTNRDFDKQYAGWYWLHPLIGGALGAIVYLILQAGLATINNSTLTVANVTDTVAGNGTNAVAVGVTAFSIAIAFLAGFKQITAVEFLSRIVKSVFQKEDSADKKPS